MKFLRRSALILVVLSFTASVFALTLPASFEAKLDGILARIATHDTDKQAQVHMKIQNLHNIYASRESSTKQQLYVAVFSYLLDNFPTDADMNQMADVTGTYQAYSENLVANYDGDTVLYFSAEWCSSCRTLDAHLDDANIPENVQILRIEYDNATDLRKKHGVTTQHTLVHVDSDGNTIKKWSGGSTLDSILKHIQ